MDLWRIYFIDNKIKKARTIEFLIGPQQWQTPTPYWKFETQNWSFVNPIEPETDTVHGTVHNAVHGTVHGTVHNTVHGTAQNTIHDTVSLSIFFLSRDSLFSPSFFLFFLWGRWFWLLLLWKRWWWKNEPPLFPF